MNKFLKYSTWEQIIRSRIIRKKNQKKDWYKKRMEICLECNHNSKFNPSKSFKEKLIQILNLSNDYCKICGCGLIWKLSIPEVECSMSEINEKPKWTSIINTKYKETYGSNTKNN